jgi:steroid 5-alpha reductase family enzyme
MVSLALTAAITAGYQSLFFVITYVFKIDTVTDFAGTSNFLVLAVVSFLTGGPSDVRKVVVTSLVSVWALRLMGFLLYRIVLWGEDRRMDRMRGDLSKLVLFWTFQAAWVWIVSLPVTILNASTRDAVPGITDCVGWILSFTGLLLESTADFQKLFFKTKPESRGKWINVGVWRWSRHPNYFGEILVWIGVVVSSYPVLAGWGWTAMLSPVFLAWLLLFVSGIPLLESSSNKKHGENQQYMDYKRRTSILIPLSPDLYINVPESVKATILLDWPMYRAR